MDGIREIMAGFDSITLDDIGKVKLMDRVDTKFVFPAIRLPEVLGALLPDYRVLEINGIRIQRYETIYYDTADFYHFHRHHTKHLNRYKVRIRRYLESKESFFEIKFKNNHGRTLKSRIAIEDPEEGINETVRSFISRKARHVNGLHLEPKLKVHFSRITLVNNMQTERVTLDCGLTYYSGTDTRSFDQIIIAEVKQDGRSRSGFIRLMRESRIRRFSISKYCLGIMTLHGHVRHNRFKPKLRRLNSIIYASNGNLQHNPCPGRS